VVFRCRVIKIRKLCGFAVERPGTVRLNFPFQASWGRNKQVIKYVTAVSKTV
jgi:hypothetical protein